MNIRHYFTTKKEKLFLITVLLIVLIIARRIERISMTVYPTTTVNPTTGTQRTLSASDSAAVVGAETARVTRVIDGDTVEIESGKRVRYIGIDTPEMTGDPLRRCFSIEARDKNKELVEGKLVRLVKDVSETDRFGRWLRYVYVGDVFVNETLVREGYAVSATFPPDVTQQELFREAENEAREQNRGLWERCTGER